MTVNGRRSIKLRIIWLAALLATVVIAYFFAASRRELIAQVTRLEVRLRVLTHENHEAQAKLPELEKELSMLHEQNALLTKAVSDCNSTAVQLHNTAKTLDLNLLQCNQQRAYLELEKSTFVNMENNFKANAARMQREMMILKEEITALKQTISVSRENNGKPEVAGAAMPPTS